MDWVLTGAAVFAAWAALSLLGYERQRRVEAAGAEAAALPAAPADPHTAAPALSKAA